MSDWSGRSSIVMNSALSELDDLLITSPYELISEQTAEQRSDNIFRKNPELYLSYLEDFWLVQSLVESFASPLRDILDQNSLSITFNDESLTKYEDFINNKLNEMGIKDEIENSLFDIIYWGAFFKRFTYTPDNKEFHIIDVPDPWKTVYIERLSKPMGYMRKGVFTNLSDGIFSAYKLVPYKRVSLGKVTIPELRKNIEEELEQPLFENAVNYFRGK